jgi:hypothetical protein
LQNKAVNLLKIKDRLSAKTQFHAIFPQRLPPAGVEPFTRPGSAPDLVQDARRNGARDLSWQGV